jgi:hypothetical protein
MVNKHRVSSKVAREVGFCDGTIAEPGGREADREDRVAAARDVTKRAAVPAAGQIGSQAPRLTLRQQETHFRWLPWC